jgi:hypothetical protein
MKNLLLLIIGTVLLPVMQTEAAMITFTMTGVATGRLGTNNFRNAAYTITSMADTTQITQSGSIFSVLASTAFISVSGIGSGTVTVPFYTYVNQATAEAGFYYANGPNKPGLVNTAFSDYALASSIGPLSGTSPAIGGVGVNTTDGLFDTGPLSIATFQASTGVPDQARTLGLLAFVFFALTLARKLENRTDARTALRARPKLTRSAF